MLRGHVGIERAEGSEFIASDSAGEDFFPSGGGVEPPATTVPDERDREGPLLIADHEFARIGVLGLEGPLLLHGVGDDLAVPAVGKRGRRWSRSAGRRRRKWRSRSAESLVATAVARPLGHGVLQEVGEDHLIAVAGGVGCAAGEDGRDGYGEGERASPAGGRGVVKSGSCAVSTERCGGLRPVVWRGGAWSAATPSTSGAAGLARRPAGDMLLRPLELASRVLALFWVAGERAPPSAFLGGLGREAPWADPRASWRSFAWLAEEDA